MLDITTLITGREKKPADLNAHDSGPNFESTINFVWNIVSLYTMHALRIVNLHKKMILNTYSQELPNVNFDLYLFKRYFL